MAFDYAKSVDLTALEKDAFDDGYFIIPPEQLKGIINPLQIERGLIIGATEGAGNCFYRARGLFEITGGPRLIANHDTAKIAKEGYEISPEELKKIYERSPSAQAFTLALPANGHVLLDTVFEDFEYGMIGNIAMDSDEHKKRMESVTEIGKKSEKLLEAYAGNVLNMRPSSWTKRYTSDAVFRECITKNVTALGGDPANSKDRAYAQYTKYLNACQILGENWRHLHQLKKWDNIPKYIKERPDIIVSDMIGIIPPFSITGKPEMDKSFPFYMGTGEIAETQIREITELVDRYIAGDKALTYPLKKALGDYALKEEEKKQLRIDNSALKNFIIGMGAYMLPASGSQLLEDFQELSGRVEPADKNEKKALRTEKRKKLGEIWHKTGDNLLSLVKSSLD